MVVINEEIIRNSETEELMKIFKIDLDEAILLKNRFSKNSETNVTDEEVKELMEKYPSMEFEFAFMNLHKGKEQQKQRSLEEFNKHKRKTVDVDSKGNFIKE